MYTWVFPKIGLFHATPKIIHFNRIFYYKPSILGYLYFWKHPHIACTARDLCCSTRLHALRSAVSKALDAAAAANLTGEGSHGFPVGETGWLTWHGRFEKGRWWSMVEDGWLLRIRNVSELKNGQFLKRPGSRWRLLFPVPYECFQKLGYPKMDGENNGNPY